MSLMGKLNFFLGLQIKQKKKNFFINLTKYIKQIIKKFGISNKSIGTPMSHACKLGKDDECKRVD